MFDILDNGIEQHIVINCIVHSSQQFEWKREMQMDDKAFHCDLLKVTFIHTIPKDFFVLSFFSSLSLLNQIASMSEPTEETPAPVPVVKEQQQEQQQQVDTQSNASLKCLVIDTNAIINGMSLRNMAEEFYTCPEVLYELRSAHSREFLSRLPFELKILNPTEEAMKFGKCHNERSRFMPLMNVKC